MRIMLATESYYPDITGGSIAEHNLALRLAKKGHQVAILAPAYKLESYEEKEESTTVYRLRAITFPLNRRYRTSPFCYSQIANLMEKFRPDIVHVHNPFPIGRATLACAKRLDIPVVGTNHFLPENLKGVCYLGIFYKFVERVSWSYLVNFYNRCELVTAPTQTALDLMIREGLQRRGRPISNGIDLEVFKPNNDGKYLKERYALPEKPLLLYTGRLSPEKCLNILIRAIPQVLKSMDVHFLLVGDGPVRSKLERLVHRYGISTNITFTGFLKEEDFPNIYTISDLFVMPSTAELQSIVTLEALASGLPVVAANKYALPEMVRDGLNGFLFESGDSNDLARKILRILSNKILQEKMGRASLSIARDHSLERVVEEFESVYKEAIQFKKMRKRMASTLSLRS